MSEKSLRQTIIADDDLYNLISEMQLVDKKLLDASKTRSIQEKTSLSDALLWYDAISDEQLGRLMADYAHIPFVALSQVDIDDDVLSIVPEVVAKQQGVVAFKNDQQGLHVAMVSPMDMQMIDFLRKKTGLPVTAYMATKRDIENTFLLYQKDVSQAFGDVINEHIRRVSENAEDQSELSIIAIVDALLLYAHQNKASDIHIEPREKKSVVRFRIDGILHDITSFPLVIHPQIISRIKVSSKLRTDEHQVPQDGKLQFNVDENTVDVRVSIVPVTDGEKVVLRLLSDRSRQFSISNLGLSASDLEKLVRAYTKPYGTILVAGPTGSGKTTTLYSILKLLNNRDVNTMTIEDPVEYDIEGVNQIQVNTKTGLTFADGLRSILRQDPNIILVGEIRDKETAGIAINLAMTGHLVLSTLHTNDAATAIPRLIDMDVEPFLVASTINVIVAQRLVREIHIACRTSEEIPLSDIEARVGSALANKIFGSADNSAERMIRVYKGKGCDICHHTGYVGRIGVFEILEIDDVIRNAITEQKDASVIMDIAIRQGMTTMLEDGFNKVKQGITTLDEVLRVTKE